jgi:hypothetical protein
MNPNKALLWDMTDVIRNAPVFASATAQMGFKTYQDASCTIQGRPTDPLGVLDLAISTGQDTEAAIQAGSGVSGMVKISQTAGAMYRYIFEAIVDVGRISDTLSWYVGPAGINAPANSLLADAGTGIGDVPFIGFRVLEADGSHVDFTYKETGGTENVVSNSALTVAADTFYRLGWVYEPNEEKIFGYVNGTKLDDAITVTSSDFPLDVVLSPLVALKSHNTTALTMGLAGMRVGVVLV